MFSEIEKLDSVNDPEKEKKPKIFLEIGCSASSMIIKAAKEDFKEKFSKDGHVYIGLDNDKKILDDFKKNNKCNELTMEFISGDMNKLPFRDNSLDQIWMLNIFSGQTWNEKIESQKDFEFAYRKLFNEFNRVLKNKGRIVLGEYYHNIGGDNLFYFLEADYSAFSFDKKIHKTSKSIKEFLMEEKLDLLAKSILKNVEEETEMERKRGKSEEEIKNLQHCNPFFLELIKK